MKILSIMAISGLTILPATVTACSNKKTIFTGWTANN